MSKRTRTAKLAGPLFGLSALILSVFGAPSVPSVRAASPAVSVGDVVVAIDGEANAELRRALRTVLSDELSQLERGIVLKRPLVVSATLTTLSSQQREQRASATAAISLALRRADDQVLFAELRGRASAEQQSGTLAAVRTAALRAAVQGAVKRLPEAVKQSR